MAAGWTAQSAAEEAAEPSASASSAEVGRQGAEAGDAGIGRDADRPRSSERALEGDGRAPPELELSGGGAMVSAPAAACMVTPALVEVPTQVVEEVAAAALEGPLLPLPLAAAGACIVTASISAGHAGMQINEWDRRLPTSQPLPTCVHNQQLAEFCR